MKTNQRGVTGVFMRNPTGPRGHRAAIKGVGGQAACGFKGHRRGSHRPASSTHTQSNSRLCVARW